MCGLAVTLSWDGRPADAAMLRRMSDVLWHRGPDDAGLATYGPIGFAFRRLSILDLSPAGHQPMETPDGTLAIVFNGEIYNYIELKRELEQLGHQFRTSGDTEVLLHAYQQWGPDCVSRFNGMWAFVLYDRPRQRVIASRDRFGVKPLYRFQSGSTIVLASEIKAIVASGLYRHETNWPLASKFLLRRRLDEDTQTFYKGVEQVAPGSVLEIGMDGRVHERRFWSLGALPPQPLPDSPAQAYRTLLEDAVRVRMRSDVPVGVCLSGGIDSSAIISLMADLWPGDTQGRLKAFSYIPDEFSEAEYIHESIARTGAELHELQITPQQLWDNLPRALWHYDEPVHSATALIGFELMRLAKSRGVTVVLNGQGSDEVNAGYPPFFRSYWTDLFRQGRWRTAWREILEYSRAHGGSARQRAADAAHHAFRSALESVPGYLSAAGRRRSGRLLADPWFAPDFAATLPPGEVAQRIRRFDDTIRHCVEAGPLPIYLRVEDRNSMAHSVEARLPFLDYRLVTLAYALPPDWKVRGPWNKFVVREATRGIIAERVRTRLDKMGFPTPSRSWFAGPWYAPMRDLLSSRTIRECGFVHVDAVTRDLERHRRGEVNAASRLFSLAEFGLWSEQAVGGSMPAPDGARRYEEAPV
jgi:asparagine synthase (glutamine-hydrolysing)